MAYASLTIRNILSACLVGTSILTAAKTLPSHAQAPAEAAEDSTNIPPQVLAEIREAPFSEIFTIADGAAFGVKDKDYNPSEPTVGVFSLWADVPGRDRTEMVMKYCVENTSIAQDSATLVEVSLLSGDTTLATIDNVIEAGTAQIDRVQPPRTSGVGTSFYYDPFYNPYYYSPFSFGISYSPTVQLPAVDCSAGLTRFNLQPIRAALAELPDQTLRMRLLFSDGNTEYWQLGRGTVNAITQLPSLRE
jgi:hypothetical protein